MVSKEENANIKKGEESDAYLQERGINNIIENLLHDITKCRPDDHLEFMKEWLATRETGKKEFSDGNEVKQMIESPLEREATVGETSEFISETVPEFAFFQPVKKPSTVSWALGARGVDSSRALFTSSRKSPQPIDSVNTTSSSSGSSALQNNLSVAAQGVSMWVPSAAPLKASPAIPSNPLPLSPTTSEGLVSCGELPSSVKKIIEGVRGLSPADHTAVIAFIDGLANRAATTRLGRRKLSNTRGSFGVNFNVDSCGPTMSEGAVPPCISLLVDDDGNVGGERKLSSVQLQQLVGDALTTSMIATGEIFMEEERAGQLSASTTQGASTLGRRVKKGSNLQLARFSDCFSMSDQILPGSNGGVGSGSGPNDGATDLSQMFSSVDEFAAVPVSFIQQYMQHSRLSSTVSRVDSEYSSGATVSSEDEVNVLRKAFRACKRFSDYSETEIEVLARNAQRLELLAGHTCNFKDSIFYVHSGLLRVENNEGVLRELPAGTFLDAQSCEQLNDAREPLEVRAVSDALVLMLKDEALGTIQENEKKLKKRMFVRCLQKSPLFATVPLKLLKNIANYMHVRTVVQGKVMLRKGEHVDWLSVVISGTVSRVVAGGNGNHEVLPQNKQKSGPSSCAAPYILPPESQSGFEFGELELLFNSPMLTDVVATTPVTLARVCTAFVHSLLPHQIINDMKYAVATNPSAGPLLTIAPDAVRHSVKMFMEHYCQSKRLGGSRLRKRISVSSTGTNSTRGFADSVRCGVLASGAKASGGANNLKVSSAGEIVYAGKCNYYRFPIAALGLGNTVVVAVVSDGTIIRWNDSAERITGFSRQQVLGHSVFSSLTTDSARRSMREQLKLVRNVAGNWNQYVSAGLSSPQVYRFRKASGTHSVGLLLSVIPSSAGSNEDVLLLVGREADNNAMTSYVEDTTRWLNDVLRPQLSAFRKRVCEYEERKWNITLEEGAKLHGYVEACNQLMDRYMRLANLNKHSVDALWKPVRMQNVLRQFLQEVTPHVQRAGNKLTTDVVAGPKGEVFLHVEYVLDVLRGMVLDANKNRPNYHMHIVVEAVLPTTMHQDSTTMSCQGEKSTSCDLAFHSVLDQSRVSLDTPHCTTSQITASEDSIRQRSAHSPRQLSKWPSYMQLIRFIFTISESESGLSMANDNTSGGAATTPSGEVPRSSKIHHSFYAGKECGDLVAAMGGEVFSEQRGMNGSGHCVTVELPLLPTPWEEEDDEDEAPTSSTTGPPFAVILADKNEKERNSVCKLLWARRHPVFSVSSLSEVMMRIESPDIGLLIIDPCHLDMTEEESKTFAKAPYPFNMEHGGNHFVVLIYTEDFDDWRVQKMKKCSHVIELPKPATTSLLHSTLYEAERMVIRVREYEERVAQMRSAFREFQAERYEMGKVLGRGSYGEVYEVVDRLTGGKLAVKRMTLSDGLLAADVAEEFLSVTSMRHKNMIHYFYCEQESETVLRLYMELASGGTLKDKIRQHGGPLPLPTVVQYLEDLCDGLAYIHSNLFVHGDIKTANALVDQYGRVKIGDFGTAKRLKRKSEKLYKFVGTPRFMAPELINADATQGHGYDQKGDIWSLGCVALELATGKPPFWHIEEAQGIGIFNFLINLKETPDLSIIEHSDPDFYAFVRRCLHVDPKERPTAQELLTSNLFQRAGTSVRDMRLAQQIQAATKLHEYAALKEDNSDDENDDDDDDEDDDDDDMFVECDFPLVFSGVGTFPNGDQNVATSNRGNIDNEKKGTAKLSG